MAIIRNLTPAPISLDDLSGITVPASGDYDLLETPQYYIDSSINLSTNIAAGNIVFLDAQGNPLSQSGSENIMARAAGPITAIGLQKDGISVTGTPHSVINFAGTIFTIVDNGNGQATVTSAGIQSGDNVSLLTNDAGYLTSSITDHALLSNVGANTHAQIDTHLANNAVHFTQAGISITESQVSDLGNYSIVGHSHLESDIADLQPYLLNIAAETIGGLSNVDETGKVTGDRLVWDGVNWSPSTPQTPQLFYGHNNTIVQTLTTTYININIATTIRADGIYSVGVNEITVNQSGWYKISYSVSAAAVTNARSIMECRLEVNAVSVPGSAAFGYHRTISSSAGDNTATADILIQLVAADVVRLRAREANGAIQTLPQGCRLLIDQVESV